MNRDELLALADRVEALTGACRETDAAIGIVTFDGGADHLDDARDVTRARKVLISHGARPGNFEVVGFSGVSLREASAFTASIDAAMTLVPEGWRPTISQHLSPLPHWHVRLQCWYEHVGAETLTPALALTSAALRAIAAQGGE